MPDKSNNPFQFWEELKRRRVIRVITVYAAAAFVILEVVSIISEPLKLPEWTLPFVIVLLSIGFIISVLLSWIYDVTSEGIQKTKSSKEVAGIEAQPTSRGWKIATFVSILIIIAFVVFYIVGNNKESINISNLEKSIAVLPFKYLSDEPDKQYLADAAMDEILLNLSKINDLRVKARTSVEQFRETDKTAAQICQELDVSYLLEGSFLKNGDQVRLIVQLIKSGKEGHIWAKKYDRSWLDIFTVQTEVAQLVADELQATITPEEKALIEKAPTSNLTAYDYYQRGREEYWRSRQIREYESSMERAEYFFKRALEYDPGYANAFAGLAMVHYSRYSIDSRSGDQYSADYYSSANLDSMNLLAQKAVELDDQIADAYFAKGIYEQEQGNLKDGLEFMQHALKINPNHTLALMGAALIYGDLYDYVKGLELLHKAASMERGSMLLIIYYNLFNAYESIGFPEKGVYYLDELLSLSGDSITHFIMRYYIDFQEGNQKEANAYAAKAFAVDSTNKDAILYMGNSYLFSKRFSEAYPYYVKYFNLIETSGDLDVNDMNRMGYVLWMTGRRDEAKQYFQEMIGHCKRHIEIGSRYGRGAASYDLAGVYTFMGEKDSAYHFLEKFSGTYYVNNYIIAMLSFLDPLFESIRHEEQFQQLLREMQAKYQAEHERVKVWLEENDML